MQFEADIDVKALKAVALFASADKTLYYLGGVYIEACNGIVTLVACDGARLAAIRLECECPAERVAFIIPSSLIANIELKKTSKDTVRIIYSGDIRIEWENQTFISKEVDGTFPDLKRIFPTDINDVTAQFDTEQLLDFKKASKILDDGGDISITHNGDAPALVNFSTSYDCVGLIMPLREKAYPRILANTPHWINRPPEVSEPEIEKVAEPA